jgi:hypothetical protein
MRGNDTYCSEDSPETTLGKLPDNWLLYMLRVLKLTHAQTIPPPGTITRGPPSAILRSPTELHPPTQQPGYSSLTELPLTNAIMPPILLSESHTRNASQKSHLSTAKRHAANAPTHNMIIYEEKTACTKSPTQESEVVRRTGDCLLQTLPWLPRIQT